MEQPTTKRTAIAPQRPAERSRRSRRDVPGPGGTFHGVALAGRLCLDEGRQLAGGAARPAVLDRRYPRLPGGRERLHEAILGRHRRCRRRCSPRCAGASRRTIPACRTPDGPWAYLCELPRRRPARAIGRTPRDGGEARSILDGDALAKAHGYFHFGGTRHSPDHRALSLERRPRGSEYFTHPRARWRAGEDLRRHRRADQRQRRVGPRFDVLLLCPPRREPPAAAGLPPSAGTAQATTCWSMRKQTAACSRASRKAPAAASASSPPATRKPPSSWLIDLSHPTPRRSWWRRARPASLQRLRSRRRALHPHQRRRCDGLPHRHGAAGHAGPRIWRDLIPHRPGHLHHRHRAYAGHLVRLERANALPSIVIRDLVDGVEHVIAFDEAAYALDIIDGYEFDTTTLRFAYSSMTTPAETYDYDMASRAAHLAQAPADPLRPRSGRLRHDAHHGAVARRRRRCRCRSCIAGTSRSTARRRCCSTATAPTAWRCRRRSRPIACRWSTAASSMPSPISAAARTRAGAGTSTASASKKTNTLRRLLAAAAHLIDGKYTSAGRIVGHGGSAGGMLMGAVANRRGRPLRRHRLRGALRRRAEHHARRHAAADAARMARMGQPDRPTKTASATSCPTRPTTTSPPRTIRRSWRWPA